MGQPPNHRHPASTGQDRRIQRYICLVYAVVIVYVSLAPGQRIPGIFNWGSLFSPDKVAHFGAYAIFAVLLSFSIGGTSIRKRTATAVVFAALFGVLMEGLQGIAGTGRDFDPIDMVANLIGAMLGGVIYLLLHYFVFKYFTAVKS